MRKSPLSHGRLLTLLLFFSIVLPLVSCSGTWVEIEGKEAPDFIVERIDGGTISLSELKGRPVILYWFSSW